MSERSKSIRPSTAVSQSSNRSEHSLGRGWLWTVICATGLLGSVFASQWAQQERLSVGRTATTIAEAQTNMQEMGDQADAVQRGDADAIIHLQQARLALMQSLNVLKVGGYVSPSDSVPVLALAGNSDIPLGDIEKSVMQFDQSSRTLIDNAGTLRQASAAESVFVPALTAAQASMRELVKLSSFSQGPWLPEIQVLSQEWNRPELQTMAIVFAPMEGAADLQQQWAERFKSQSDVVANFAALANRDARVSGSDKSAFADFAKQVATVASASAVLASSTPVRLKALADRAAWMGPVLAGQNALAASGSVVFEMDKGRGVGIYVAWVLDLLSLLGLGLLAHEWATNQRAANLVSQESVVVQHGQEQIDQVVRQLRRIVPGDGPIQRGMHLHEEPESSAFPLAAMINRLLDTFDYAEDEIKQRASEIDLTLASGMEAGTNLSTQSQRHRQAVALTETSVLNLANQAAGIARRGESLLQGLEQCAEHIRQTASTLQQGLFKSDALRENTQDSAKRIKRLSESAQAISMAVDLIYGVIQQVQVLSMNVAIEAANAGDQGRSFVVISQEIQRLVTKGTSAAHQIDKIIEAILTDAKETVATMEQGTSEVVESGRLNSRAMTILREAERDIGVALGDLPKLGKDLEKQALAGAQAAEQMQDVGKNMSQATADANRAQEAFGTARTCATKIVRFIEQAGSRNVWGRR